jgi:hypothetical protein
MSPRPIHRWKSFWLGLFAAGFLAWAWWDSHTHETIAYRAGWTRTTYLYRASGETTIAQGPSLLFDVSGKSWGYIHQELPLLPPVWELSDDVRRITIADPLVFFTYLGLWSAWLAWHGRREQRKRLTESETEIEPDTP